MIRLSSQLILQMSSNLRLVESLVALWVRLLARKKSEGMNSSEKIYAEAKKYLGTKESPGSASTTIIRQWITAAADWLDKDDSKTAWCGCFRGAVGMATGTGVPKAHYRAVSWQEWGNRVPLSNPKIWQQGDTVVMTRPGGNHVCIIDRVVGDYAYCLGGNQSDAVTVSRFPISRITAVRRG